MTILDTFFILFESDTSKLDKGLGASEKKSEALVDKLKDVDKTSAKAGEGLMQMVGKLAGLAGLGLSVGVLVAGIKDVAKSYDELGKLAARFRDTVDAIDEFRDAASLLSITEETSTNALKALDTAIQDTYLGLGRSKKVFEELGITVTDANGKIKPVTAVMGELAGVMKDMEKGTQIRVMERLGLDPSLLKLFNSDLVALQARMAAVDKASGFNLEEAVKRAKDYTKAQKELTLEVNVLRMYIGKLVESFQIAALPIMTDAMKTTTKYVRMFVEYIMQHRRVVEGAFVALGSAILYFLVPAAIKGAIAVWAMIAPFALIAIAVVAVGAAFALLYDDIMNFIDGNDSLIGQILAKYPMIAKAVSVIADTFKEAWGLLKNLASFLVDVWDNPKEAFEDFLLVVMHGLKALIDMIPGLSQAFQFGQWLGDKMGIAGAQEQLGAASRTPLGSMTSGSISNSRSNARSTSVQIGEVKVQTQATDAAGISKAIGGSMESQMRQAVSNFDDGILA